MAVTARVLACSPKKLYEKGRNVNRVQHGQTSGDEPMINLQKFKVSREQIRQYKISPQLPHIALESGRKAMRS